jgi:integral membrane protein (TIGR01906 family)
MHRMQKILSYILSVTLSLLFVLALLVTCINLVTFDIDFYRQQYDALDNHIDLKISRGELHRVTLELLDYLSGERSDLETIYADVDGTTVQFFNQREIDHMLDVKNLFKLADSVRFYSILLILVLGTAVYFISLKKPWLYISRAYIALFIVIVALSGLLYLLMQVDFTRYWDQFHYILFDNDLWILNPETDRLILMVPEPFFYSAVTRVLGYTAVGLLLPAAASTLYLYLSRRRSIYGATTE